ncbi:MAG: DUF4332 domain-containing protein [Planctomycetaceae bacterium]|nr:DUF4332 domain-containing protein [Planctomycetaceae bacterium]
MVFTQLTIDGFGVLSNLSLRNLASGLNVIHGANGSGKTTMLHFLRGVLCGFGDARRLRLLPPLKGGAPGGSVGVEYQGGQYSLIRHLRPDQSDTLAVNLTHGRSDDVPALRKLFDGIDRDLFYSLFAVGNYESHAVEPLVRLALRDGIPLHATRRQAAWLEENIASVRREREGLHAGVAARGQITELEQRRNLLGTQVRELADAQQREHELWAQQVERLREQITRLQQETEWLHQELQLAQSDLTEVHDRLWSRRREVIRQQQVVERPGPQTTPAWVLELRELDAQIAHSQQVLRDLAESRRQLSVKSAGLAGVETPEIETYFARHRAAISRLEQQAERLDLMQRTLAAARAGEQCVCGQLQSDVGTTLTSIRQQLSLICQELSRQQSVHAQVLLLSEREGIDQCELEVVRQIQRLRQRRDELLHAHGRGLTEMLQFRTSHESAHCECVGHEGYLASLPAPLEAGATVRETIVHEQVEERSNARPGDADLAVRLKARVQQLQAQWWDAQRKWCAVRNELERLLQQPRVFANDPALQRRRYEYVVVEQQLADAREQWQSVALLQQVLKSTQERLHVETRSPVIEEASSMLHRLTQGRYPRFQFDSGQQQLLVENEAGESIALHALSRGTLDQAALAFRLALWNAYLQRGVHLPLVLDDVLNDSDEHRLQIAVDVLTEYGAAGRQILFFTCQEHLANLFERAGVAVRDLPGSDRGRMRSTVNGHVTQIAPVITADLLTPEVPARAPKTPVADWTISEVEQPEFELMSRIQPDEPFWLQADSPLMNVPSLSAQMARRLGALGVRHVADLVDLDPEFTEIPLDSLQISAATLRDWQAECRLLTCVPDLTGRDAQVLVAVGVLSPTELAEVDVDALLRRIDQLRHRAGRPQSLTWLMQQSNWPSQDTARRWRQSARRARSFQSARSWASTRRGFRGRETGSGRLHRFATTTGHEPHRDHDGRARDDRDRSRRDRVTGDRTSRSRTTSGAATTVRTARSQETSRMNLVSQSDSDTSRELRFFLNLESPIVDAPSIGPKMAKRLEKIGVVFVTDLLSRDPDVVAEKLDHSRTNGETVKAWQQQASLMCAVPEMRGHDVQVLVACDILDADKLASFTPDALFAIVGPFVKTKEGQRVLRSSKVPDLQEVTEWIEYARHARVLKAA